MTRRQQRMALVAAVVLGVAVAVGLGLRAFEENLLYFYSTSQVLKGEAPAERKFRVGGLVVDGSVEREEGSLTVRFQLTDTATKLPVTYTGILPDLFREGQGIVTHGKLVDGVFIADEVLAKHDENYMPPEVEDSIKSAHEEGVARAKAEGRYPAGDEDEQEADQGKEPN
ncbi:MAG: cytochrome c maturation protein CcmE [Gammaproteobacteria bacterium]|nr:cytochrome c maturation protein CcmE [Gammaproteobacteria bacterium]